MLAHAHRFVTDLAARGLVLALVLAGVALTAANDRSLNGRPALAADGNIDGSTSQCEEWRILFDLILFDFDVEFAEEGWIYANGFGTEDRFREASGIVTKSKIAHNDTPANHYSHDWNVDIRVDPGQEGLVSDVNGPNATGKNIEMEWETGVTPDETDGDGANPSIPRWVLPNLGDRAWAEGHWVFDCGHSKDVGGVPHFPTEIHPARALASMRPQADVIPGSGTTPVPVTATDLYIHGAGTFMVQQLHCGIDVILQFIFEPCEVQTTPIDTEYSFEVCLPPKPVPWATLEWSNVPGPDDDGFGLPPEVEEVDAAGGCLLSPDDFGNTFDAGTMLQVTVDLSGTGIQPEDIYSRKIVAGWVYPPVNPLPHLSLDLTRLDLEEDHEIDLPFVDAEFTFWWMGIDRAPVDEWYRLVNFEIPTTSDSTLCPEHTNHLNDMDDDDSCGDGLLNFFGPTWEFYLREGQAFNLHTTGFEQDCYDRHFGSGVFSIFDYVVCYAGSVFEFANDWGNNDGLPPLDHAFGGPGIDPLSLLGNHTVGDPDEFEFDLTLGAIALTDEDDAELSLVKTCSHPGEVALAGQPFTCTIVVSNAGPGLPRNVVVSDVLTSTVNPLDYSVGQATFRVNAEEDTHPCDAPTDAGFECAIGTVTVGGAVTISVQILPLKPGQFGNSGSVTTDSVEADDSDNSGNAAVDVFLPVIVDISPGSAINPLNLSKKGVVTVAIISTAEFDATSLAIATACFGDSGDPAQRNCTEEHGTTHVADADKDKDDDLLFHYSVLETGIDLGDATACLRGTTEDGNGFYGCDAVSPM
jgi:uncharacterized repeat protein (TIGR01451 family)